MKHLIFDVGMHLGEDTAFYLALGHDVVAFEANPDLVKHNQERFRDDLKSGKLTIISGAITDRPVETLTFYVNERSEWGTTQEDWAERNASLGKSNKKITVPAVRFEECMLRYGTPYYIKIDVEGVDRVVLGTVCSATTRPKYLSIESEKVSFDKLDRDIRQLEEAGYSHFKVVQQCAIPGSSVRVERADGTIMKYRFEKHASGAFSEHLPGEWLTSEQTRAAYRRIFSRYRLLGQQSLLGRHANKVIGPVERVTGIGLPGWHDLHAKLG